MLNCQTQSCNKKGLPATCVEPLPIELVKVPVQGCCAYNMEKDACIADMITIGFFLLCCPREP